MIRAARGLAIALLILSHAAIAQAGFVGVYIWGGQLTAHRGVQGFHDTVALTLAAGFDTIRFSIEPNEVQDYGLAPDPCAAKPSLACYARVMFASKAWDDPTLKRVILTTTDFTCFGARRSNDGCLDAKTLTDLGPAIVAEYLDLFAVLAARFEGRGIEVVVSNWEGDNFIYCGDSFSFGTAPAIGAACERRIVAANGSNAARIDAFLQWVGLKDEAVRRFLATHPRFSLVAAPEFNNMAQFPPGCGGRCDAATDTVFAHIAAAGGREACSYSSYDTLNGPPGALVAAVRTILKACRHVILGEAGGDLAHLGDAREAALFARLHQVRDLPGLDGIVLWHAVDPPASPTRYGLWDAAGRPQVLPLLGPLAPPR